MQSDDVIMNVAAPLNFTGRTYVVCVKVFTNERRGQQISSLLLLGRFTAYARLVEMRAQLCTRVNKSAITQQLRKNEDERTNFYKMCDN